MTGAFVRVVRAKGATTFLYLGKRFVRFVGRLRYVGIGLHWFW